MNGNPVGWFEIYTDDIQRARQFYEAVFEVTLEPISDPTNEGFKMLSFPSEMESYGSGGALVQMSDYPAGKNSIIVYFSCEDCAVEEARVEKAGGKLERSKMSIGEYGFISLARDTEGNMIGLHSLS